MELRNISKAELDKIIDNHKKWLQSGGSKGERADLSSADLRSADLRYADLRSANLDFSAFPLWCGGLDVHIDDRQATQLLYHLIRNVKYSDNTSKKLKKLCKIKSLVKQANEFHRVKECGEIVIEEGGDNGSAKEEKETKQ